ncbi:MAG: hypothetical protein IJ454_03010 [Clostridia bacterium]|nr:hypothetical protein [Clostridia bacterium]
MKKRFFGRIGAILTAAAMLMTLLPAAMPVMAEVEAVQNLITNGDFSSTEALTEAITYESTADSKYNITLPEGTLLPTGWDLICNEDSLNAAGKTYSLVDDDNALGTTNALVFKGTAFALKQTVTGLTSGQSYRLSLLMNAGNNNGVTIGVNYLNYNESFSGTFTKSVQLCGNAVGNSEDCGINFTLPPEADAAEIVITVNGGSSSTVRIDNIVLIESDELINDGGFEIYRSDKNWFTTWSPVKGVYPKQDGVTGAVVTGAAVNNYAGFFDGSAKTSKRNQELLVKPDTVYKLSFKYAHQGFGEEIAPNVSLAYSGNNGENASVIAPAFSKAPEENANGLVWTTYETYIVTPSVPDEYAYGLVNATLTTSVGEAADKAVWSETTSMVYYDDISLTEAELTTAQNSVTFNTGDTLYIPVDGCEHYALTVDNSEMSTTDITATVSFWNKAEDGSYSAVKLNAQKYNAKKASTIPEYSSLDRPMYGEDNVFNFTTPKTANYVTVNAVAGGAAIDVSATLAVTNEIVNNGSAIADTALPGWYASNNSLFDGNADYIASSGSSSTNICQHIIFKSGSTYKIKFKYAQKGTGRTTYLAPKLYFDGLIGELISVPSNTHWEEASVLKSAPSAGDWTEYEAYFIAGASDEANTTMTGLVQARMLPRTYKTTDAADDWCTYYDDISIEEVDSGSYIWYTNEKDISVSGKSLATQIRYHYVKAEGDTTRKFIYAEYDTDDNLTYVMPIEVSASGDYDITINDATASSKVFLLDSETLAPLMSAMID